MTEHHLRSRDGRPACRARCGAPAGRADVYTVTAPLLPRNAADRLWTRVRELVLGPPLPSRLQRAERLGILGAVALIGSDMIASSVYGPEEMILHLGEAGPGGVAFAFPLAVGISVLLAILAASYWQTIKAYPSGAGGYIVAKDNFGPFVGIVGAAALLIDYTLDVAVSIATGVQSITSALPDIAWARVWLCLAALVLITLANLRGIRAGASYCRRQFRPARSSSTRPQP